MKLVNILLSLAQQHRAGGFSQPRFQAPPPQKYPAPGRTHPFSSMFYSCLLFLQDIIDRSDVVSSSPFTWTFDQSMLSRHTYTNLSFSSAWWINSFFFSSSSSGIYLLRKNSLSLSVRPVTMKINEQPSQAKSQVTGPTNQRCLRWPKGIVTVNSRGDSMPVSISGAGHPEPSFGQDFSVKWMTGSGRNNRSSTSCPSWSLASKYRLWTSMENVFVSRKGLRVEL